MIFAGNRRPGDDGLHDLRLRRRPGGRLGARRGRLLGPRARLARRRAPHRRPGAGESAGRRPDGPDLRQPGGPERRPGPAHGGPGHPRDVPAHGDGRRGDRRADRRAATRSARPTARPTRRATSAPSPRAPRSRSRAWAGGAASAPARAADAITSGLEGTWTPTPTRWDNSFLETLFGYEWDAVLSPAGAVAVDPDGRRRGRHRAGRPRPVEDPRPDDPDDRPRAAVRPGLRADLAALPGAPGPARGRVRPGLVQADAPRHGPDPALPRPAGPAGDADLAGPGPRAWTTSSSTPRTSPRSRARSSASGLSVAQLVSTAWASASTFRGSDKRGGANGARIRLEPQRGWEVNEPDALAQVLRTLEGIQESFNGSQSGGKKVSLADLIVLGGCAAVEQAAADRGPRRRRSPSPRAARTPSQEQTDVGVLRPARARRGRVPQLPREGQHRLPSEHLLVDRANLLTLSAPEMTVLVGGLRVLGANFRQSAAGRPHRGARVADQRLLREPARHGHGVEADVRRTRRPSRAATAPPARSGGPRSRVDLVFGSNSELRALAEVYASDDAQEKFVHDFVAAWDKVMNLDRFDLADSSAAAHERRVRTVAPGQRTAARPNQWRTLVGVKSPGVGSILIRFTVEADDALRLRRHVTLCAAYPS